MFLSINFIQFYLEGCCLKFFDKLYCYLVKTTYNKKKINCHCDNEMNFLVKNPSGIQNILSSIL